MDEVHRWVFTVCCGALLCGIVSVLLPNKGMEKLMRMVLGLFLLCCLLLPVGKPLPFPDLELEGAQAEAERAAGEVAGFFLRDSVEKGEAALRQAAAKELREYGIKEEDIQIYIEADGGEQAGSLGKESPSEITARVRLPQRLRELEEEFRERLKDALGVDVQLEYNGE